MRTHAYEKGERGDGSLAAPGTSPVVEETEQAREVARERAELLARKHRGQRLSPDEQERVELLTTRLRELLPPVSVKELETLLEMAEESESIRNRARERRQRFGLG